MRKLKTTEVAMHREMLIEQQHGKCALCHQPFEADAVLDHDHKTGIVRGVLHRGCNAMLGHIENNRARNYLTDDRRLYGMLSAAPRYIVMGKGKALDPSAVLYPTHKNDEEKRLLRNKRARKARVAKKEAA